MWNVHMWSITMVDVVKKSKKKKKTKSTTISRPWSMRLLTTSQSMRVTTSTRPHAQWNFPSPFLKIEFLAPWACLPMLSPEPPSTLPYNTQNPLTGLATMAEFHIQLSRSNSSHTVLTKCLNCLNQNLDAEIIFRSFFCNKSDQFVFFVFCSEVCAWNRQQKLTKDSKIIF